MSAVCDNCSETVYRYSQWMFKGKWKTECHVCAHPRHSAPSVVNPFSDLTLDHVRDEQGNPVRVTSLRQLREAEKRYKFRSVIANSDEKNFDKPPQTKKTDVFEAMSRERKWLYPEIAEPMLKEMRQRGEL